MQKKFTKGTPKHQTDAPSPKAALWRRLLLPPVGRLVPFLFLSVLFLFPLDLFAGARFPFLALPFALYVLLSLCLRLPAFFRTVWGHFAKNSHRFDRRELWARLTLLGGLLFNLTYAVFRTVAGLFTNSLWFCAEGVYYMGLGTARFLVAEADRTGTPAAESYKRGGKLLLLLSLSAVGTVTLAVGAREAPQYTDTIIFATALFAAWRVLSALFQIFWFHRRHRAVPLLAKAISLSAAAVSLFGLQTTLLARFGVAPARRLHWNVISGVILCISLPVTALFILWKGKKLQ